MNTNAQRLWDLGYLWQMTRDDAGKLADTDLEFVSACTRLQERFSTAYQAFGDMHYGRSVDVDGVAGKATGSMLDPKQRVCGMPDIPPPDDVDLTQIDDPFRREAIESMRGMGGIERGTAGGWRKGCNPTVHAGYTVKVFFDVGSFKNTIWKDSWPEIQEAIIRDYALYGLLIIPVKSKADANIHFHHRDLSGGTIGLAQLPGKNASCSLKIWSTVDTDWGKENKFARYRVSEHELGHSVDLQHTNGGLMNPYIILVTSYVGFKNDPSERALKAYYGGIPIDKPDDPPPTDPKPEVLATVDVSKVETIQIVSGKSGGGGWW